MILPRRMPRTRVIAPRSFALVEDADPEAGSRGRSGDRPVLCIPGVRADSESCPVCSCRTDKHAVHFGRAWCHGCNRFCTPAVARAGVAVVTRSEVRAVQRVDRREALPEHLAAVRGLLPWDVESGSERCRVATLPIPWVGAVAGGYERLWAELVSA